MKATRNFESERSTRLQMKVPEGAERPTDQEVRPGTHSTATHGREGQTGGEKRRGPGVARRSVNWLGIALLLCAFSSCGKSETPPGAAGQKVSEPANTPPQPGGESELILSSEAKAMLGEAHTLFQQRFKKWGDSYYTVIPGFPDEDSTLIERPVFSLVHLDKVTHAVTESPVSDVESRNGISAKGNVRYSSVMSRRFTPGTGWGEWSEAGAFFGVSYLIKGGNQNLEEAIADEAMTAPSAEQLYAAGVPEDSSDYWNRHLAKFLQPAFDRAEADCAAAEEAMEKAAIWRRFLLDRRALQDLSDSGVTDPVMNEAMQLYASLCQEEWKSIFEGAEGRLPTFGDPKVHGISPDHPLAGGMALIREHHGSGLQGHFEGRPAFTNSIGMTFLWCPENAREEIGRERIHQENRARELKTNGFEGPDLRARKFATRGFWISESEVTRGQWATMMAGEADNPDLPLTGVSFQQGKTFCRILTRCEQTSLSFPVELAYDIPTEEEWNHARNAGGGEGEWKSNLPENAWLAENSKAAIQPVKGRLANPWGIYDLIGNVAEHVIKDGQPGMAGGGYSETLSDMQKYGGASKVFGEDAGTAERKDLGLRLIIRL